MCKSCCATKDVEEFDGFKTCSKCREAKRKCYGKNKNDYSQARREERAKGSQLRKECGHKIKNENWDAHFHYALHPNSELNILMKGYSTKRGNLRKEGKLNDELQAEIQAEYEKQKRQVRKRFNEQFPNKFQDEPEEEEQPEDKKRKPDINKLFNHVNQFLMNDEFLEDYLMIFQKQKDRVIIEIPIDNS